MAFRGDGETARGTCGEAQSPYYHIKAAGGGPGHTGPTEDEAQFIDKRRGFPLFKLSVHSNLLSFLQLISLLVTDKIS